MHRVTLNGGELFPAIKCHSRIRNSGRKTLFLISFWHYTSCPRDHILPVGPEPQDTASSRISLRLLGPVVAVDYRRDGLTGEGSALT